MIWPRLFYLFLLCLVLCRSVQVDLALPPLSNITQQSNPLYLTLKPGEVYVHHSDFLEGIGYYSQNCQSLAGQLVEEPILTFSSNAKDQYKVYEHFYSQKYGILYRFQHQTIRAYKLSQLNKSIVQLDKLEFKNSHCQAQMVLSWDKQNLYHFSCQKITKIQMKKSFSGISIQLQLSQMFYGFKVISIPDMFIWAAYSEGIKIFTTDQNMKLIQTQTLQQFPQKITDILYHNNMLFILGIQQSIYIYEQTGTGKLLPKTNITIKNLCSSCRNQNLIAHNSNLFIYSVQKNDQFISQLQLVYGKNKQISGVNFVRYYKGPRNFIEMEIFDGRLLAVYRHFVNLYQINRDPRTIKRLLNGVSNTHFQEIVKLQRVSNHLFVKSTQSSSVISKISIKNPEVHCLFEQESKQYEKFQVQQPCRSAQNIQYNKINFSNVCTNTQVVNIRALAQGSGYQHIFAIFSVLIFCAAVLLILIIWRRGKMQLIQDLVNEIRKIKPKNKQQNVEFVEQKPSAKQSNWNQIHESYGSQEKNHEEQVQVQIQIQMQDKSNKKQKHKQQILQQQQINNVQGTERNMVQNQNKNKD